MKANGLAYFIDALSRCISEELSFSAADGEEPVAYTDNQLLEHVLPPRPQTNDLKAAFRQAMSDAAASGLTDEEARLQAEETLLELDSKPRSATKLSRLKNHATPHDVAREFALSNDLDEDHAVDPVLLARDAQDVMRRLARRETVFCSAAGKKSDGRSFTRTLNAVRTIVLSGRFSLLIENDFKKALIAYLEESHQSRAVGDFTNTLTVLMRDEQEAATRAIDAADLDEAYRACLDARVEIMGYLLAVALCGAAGVEALSRDHVARADIPTRYAPLAASDGDAHAREACLAEQLIDSAGNLSFGATIALDRARGLLIGRAPEEQRGCDILRVRYVADAVGSSVSRTHALVRFDEGRGRWEILDLGSSNGTAVAHLEGVASGRDESFAPAVLADDPEVGETLSNGDAIFLAPTRYIGGDLGPSATGAAYRFVML